jgi:hypothetical protein
MPDEAVNLLGTVETLFVYLTKLLIYLLKLLIYLVKLFLDLDSALIIFKGIL